MMPKPVDNPMPYPFDPTDWGTITPLFNALQTAEIAPDGFMDWLNQWNQLDIAIWDAYTYLKRRAYLDTSDHEAEHIYQAYVQQLYSTYLGQTQMLRQRALTLQPEAPTPQYQQLWRSWHNQNAIFHPLSLPVQAEISRLEGLYREIMRGYENPDNDPFAYWIERRDPLNELMLQLLKQRRILAQINGLPNFLEYRWRELNRLDYSIADCQSFHHAVETKVVPVLTQLRSQPESNQPFPVVSDPDTLISGIEHILGHIDTTFGNLFQAMKNGYLDVGSRPNKASAVEAWFFPRAAMPYLHVSTHNAGSLLHESGHAIHFYLSFQSQQSLWNYGAPEEFQEFAAMSLEMLAWAHYDHANNGLFTADESAAAKQNALKYYADCLSNSVMQDAFEHWVYGEAPDDVTPDDLDAKWLELKQRFMPWDDNYPNQKVAMTGWQRWTWSLFRIPLYMIAYPTAVVGVCQFAQRAENDDKNTIQAYKNALSLGNTRPLPELFRIAGVDFPFTAEAVEAAARFIAQSW